MAANCLILGYNPADHRKSTRRVTITKGVLKTVVDRPAHRPACDDRRSAPDIEVAANSLIVGDRTILDNCVASLMAVDGAATGIANITKRRDELGVRIAADGNVA